MVYISNLAIQRCRVRLKTPIQIGTSDFLDDDVFLSDDVALFSKIMNAFENHQQMAEMNLQNKAKREDKPEETMKNKDKPHENVGKILKEVQKRPQWHQDMVRLLQNHIKDDWTMTMSFAVDETMFPGDLNFFLYFEVLLAPFVNHWLD